MGEKRRNEKHAGGGDEANTSGPASAEDSDLHTVFVRSLPFSLTDSQLEDVFSEIGPVRHCFTIKEKGSDQHRGFGFVHFAVTEDAQRAVQEKNGALVQGRKIKVEIAKRRAPLDQRRPPRPDPPNAESTISEQEQTPNLDGAKVEPKKRKSSELQDISPDEKISSQQNVLKKIKPDGQVKVKVQRAEGKKEQEVVPAPTKQKEKKESEQKTPDVKSQLEAKDGETNEQEEAHGSAKQRPARTVVLGGLLNTEMFEAVLAVAKTVGPVESVQRALSEHEINSRRLAQDGCKPRAAEIVFLSVKAGMQAVAALHSKSIGGGVVWARQLGGEGSKLKKWRLIVRNLPFQVTESQLRELFSPIGFLWEVTIPRKPDGMSKGFAFVGFTNKSDAEKAIKGVNGKTVAKRPVAVDWAVAKNEYQTVLSSVKTPDPAAVVSNLEDSDTTASDTSEDGLEVESPDSEVPVTKASTFKKQPAYRAVTKSSKFKPFGEEGDKQILLVDTKSKENKLTREGAALDEEDGEQITVPKKKVKRSKVARGEADEQTSLDEDMENQKPGHVENMDISEEMDMVKKIMKKVVSTTQSEADIPMISDDDDAEEKQTLTLEPKGTKKKAPEGKEATSKLSTEKKPVENASEKDGDKNGMGRTVFIRNLPPEAKVPELRKLFSDFGVVKSFRMVVHPVTLRPKGTAFLEYATKEAADSAMAAACTSDEGMNGLMIKGRQISVTSAVDRDTARDMAKSASKQKEQEDRRNMALAKEGLIPEGTPAAEGVSKKDLEKRKMLEHEKATKLRSPNFHVSRTRLSVHNVPKGLTEKALKKLFIEAVKSRASKQHPVIKQVKILRDEETGKARGTAFVEFTEHQHALVALRVLNNNPATFTPESRPVVEFAVENSLILRKRAVQLERQKKFQAVKEGKKIVDTVDGKEKLVGKLKEGKKSRGDEADRKGGEQVDGERAPRKSGSSKNKGKNRENGIPKSGDVLQGEQPSSTKGRKRKREEQDRRPTKAGGEGMIKKGAKEAGQGGPTKSMDGRRDGKAGNGKSSKLNEAKQPVATKEGRKAKGGSRKQLSKQSQNEDDSSLREKKRNRKLSKVKAAEDRLDKLVNEYRTKYFTSGPTSKSNSNDAGRTAVTAGDLRRWFE